MESEENTGCGIQTFQTRDQAEKARDVLRFMYSLHTTLEEGQEKDRTVYHVRPADGEDEKAEKLGGRIDGACMVVRCFQVGDAFPTITFSEGTSRFPTEVVEPEND